MELKIPEVSLVVLVGMSGSGKSSFARKHFKPTEVISSDACRGMVSDDENDQSATDDAFNLLRHLVGIRLRRGLLTVIDATNVQQSSRKGLVDLAREFHCLPVAIVLDIPEKICEERNKIRPDRAFGAHVLRQQRHQLKKSMRGLGREGFRHVHILGTQEEVDAVTGIARERLYNNRKDEHGPFDIIGDVHGCYDELVELLTSLGYSTRSTSGADGKPVYDVTAPAGRKALFVGDLVDRGARSPDVLRLVMGMVKVGTALCVPGNHDLKLHKKLTGKKVTVNHGLAETLAQLEQEPTEFIAEVERFLYSLVSHYVLDDGKLVVAHAGIKENMQGRGSGAVRAFCLYGETTGETDEFGLPVRFDWAQDYRGKAKVVFGHTPVVEAEWLNRTINIDTGCVFGGKLTALRYPEEELVSVNAKATYCEPVRPIGYGKPRIDRAAQHEHDDVLDIKDVTGKRIVQTRLRHNITIREENSIAALEVMSRFAVDPKWLIYLPPTMSPCETSQVEGLLEHPAEAFRYYAKRGVKQVICEEKHMGSRAIVIICKNGEAAKQRFGVEDGGMGVCFTRTGRLFFNDEALGQAFLDRVANALTAAGAWAKFNTDWFCLDCELMPWSAKAQSLLKDQYGAVGAASTGALSAVSSALEQAHSRSIDGIGELLQRNAERTASAERFVLAYEQYCWTVSSLDDYKLAPFHIMATEGAVHVDKDHGWHMEQIRSFCEADPMLLATRCITVDPTDEASVADAVIWWKEMTGNGGEGMVVKPMDFLAYSKDELLQPAIKCRGSEYLRIIYGPDYDHPANLARLRERGLSTKRSLAIREFALGIEALERFVRKEPLRSVHESVFGVLALESEEVDPRL